MNNVEIIKIIKSNPDGTFVAHVTPKRIGVVKFVTNKECNGWHHRTNRKDYMKEGTLPAGHELELRACNVDKDNNVAYLEYTYNSIKEVSYFSLDDVDHVSGNMGVAVTGEAIDESIPLRAPDYFLKDGTPAYYGSPYIKESDEVKGEPKPYGEGEPDYFLEDGTPMWGHPEPGTPPFTWNKAKHGETISWTKGSNSESE